MDFFILTSESAKSAATVILSVHLNTRLCTSLSWTPLITSSLYTRKIWAHQRGMRRISGAEPWVLGCRKQRAWLLSFPCRAKTRPDPRMCPSARPVQLGATMWGMRETDESMFRECLLLLLCGVTAGSLHDGMEHWMRCLNLQGQCQQWILARHSDQAAPSAVFQWPGLRRSRDSSS